MYFLLFISFTKAIQREELYKYQIEQIFTQQNEDFILVQDPFMIRIEDRKQLQIFDHLGLIKQTNHSFDKIIAIRQNEFEKQDQIWILYIKDNQTILSKHWIDESNQENYYLQLNDECYTFYFISQYQIVIDCQNEISNIIILFDIQYNQQQSFFHSQYKESKLRKLLKAELSNLLIFIQQELILKICSKSNKLQVCDQMTYPNDAHTAYTYSNQLALISDNWIDTFIISINYQITFIKREDFKNLPIEKENPILFYYNNFQYKNIFIVESNRIIICSQVCETIKLNFAPLMISEQQSYLIVQTIQNIIIICMWHKKIFTIDIMFQNQLVAVNRELEEFYIIGNTELRFYGSTQINYLRVKNQGVVICYGKFQGDYKKQSQQLDKINVLFDDNFIFKNYGYLQIGVNKFVLSGGLLDISFQVEDKYKNQIKINLSYFLIQEYQQVQYFWFNIQDLFFRQFSVIIFENQTIIQTKFNDSQEYQFDINDLQFLQQIQSFDQGYLMQDVRDGVKYIMRINDQLTIDLIQFDCRYNLTVLTCYFSYCICLNDTQIVIQKIGSLIQEIHILYKTKSDIFLNFDYQNSILYLIKENQLIIKYYDGQQKEIHTNLIIICSTFINLVIFKLKLIIICTDKMILYNKISDYRYIYSGNIEMYDQQFTKSSQIINSDDYLFYIIEDQILHVFNSNLPLSQMYVTKIKLLSKFDTIKSISNQICFQYRQNLSCYWYQINIKFTYDDDQVEYHQVFKVNICGENKYDRKCKQYITRLDQQANKIKIKREKQQLTIKKNQNEILLDNRYFTGSIDKIQINKHQLKPKIQLYALAQINPIQSTMNFYGGYDNLIFIINNQQLFLYDIEKKSIKSMITPVPMRHFFKYKNYQVLIGYNCISLINQDSNVVLTSFIQKLSIIGFYYIHNNTLHMTEQSSLISYNLDNLVQNGSLEPIEEELNANMIDISQDTNGNMCMVYINQKFKLVFKYLERIKIYDILKSLRRQGVDLNYIRMDIFYSIKLLNDCKVLYINAIFGTYFLEVSTELAFLAQILVQKSSNLHLSQLLIGENNLYYILQTPQYISIYKFTYHQIYNSKFIEQHSQIQKQNRQYSYKDNYFQVYNDQLYLAQTDSWTLFLFIVTPEIIIQLDQDITNKEEIKISLSNTDENKSFILEIVVEESNSFVYCIVFVALLLIFYIWLIYWKVNQKK